MCASAVVYKTRFSEAMHRYFLMVPDPWTGTSLLRPQREPDQLLAFTLEEVQAPVPADHLLPAGVGDRRVHKL